MAYNDSQPRDSDGKFSSCGGQEQACNLKPEIAYGFKDKLRKNSAHHIEHAKEMGFKNQDEYEKAAVKFFNSKNGKLYYSTARSRFYRYDEKTGALATSSDGIIHTFMLISKQQFKKMQDWDKLNEQR